MSFENVKINYKPEFKYTELDTGITMSHVELGPENGENIVLIHGAIDSFLSFSQVGSYLASLGYHVYLPEMRGHGHTEKPDGVYSFTALAEDIKNWSDKTGLKKAIYGGHSLGSIVVQYLAAKYPVMVKAAVLLSTGYKLSGPALEYVLDGDGDFPGIRNTGSPSREWIREYVGAPNKDPLFNTETFEATCRLPYSTWYSAYAGSENMDTADLLPDITCPVLIIWGSEDGFFGRDAQNYILTHVGSDHVLFLEKSGYTHDLHWCDDLGKEITSDIDRFIRENL